MLAALEPHGYMRQAGSAGSAWQFVPVLAPSSETRVASLTHARRRGVELRTYFTVPLHRMPAFASTPAAGALARTEDLAARILSLPMANDLSDDDIDAIVACLSN